MYKVCVCTESEDESTIEHNVHWWWPLGVLSTSIASHMQGSLDQGHSHLQTHTNIQTLDFSEHTAKLSPDQCSTEGILRLQQEEVSFGLCKKRQCSRPRRTTKTVVNPRIITASTNVSISTFESQQSLRRFHKSPLLTIQQNNLSQSGLYQFK